MRQLKAAGCRSVLARDGWMRVFRGCRARLAPGGPCLHACLHMLRINPLHMMALFRVLHGQGAEAERDRARGAALITAMAAALTLLLKLRG